MIKTILLFDLSEKNRLEAMVRAFAQNENVLVYYFQNGKYRIFGEKLTEVTALNFDLIVQHRSDPIPDDISFVYRLWYGGGIQMKNIDKEEAIITRPISNTGGWLSKREALEVTSFFFNNGPIPDFIHQNRRKPIDFINEFIKDISRYLDQDVQENIDMHYIVDRLKEGLAMEVGNSKNKKLVEALENLKTLEKSKLGDALLAIRKQLILIYL